MTDLTQSNWYEAIYMGEDDGGNPFATPNRTPCRALRFHLRTGGTVSTYPGNAKFSIGQFNIVDLSCRKAGVASATVGVADLWTGANRAEVSASLPDAESRDDIDPWARFDRALGLTPQMEKAAE